MKKYFLSVILLSFITLSFGQSNLEEKLKKVFTETRVNNILEDSQKKKYFNNILFHSFKIESVDLNKIKSNSFSILNSINLYDKNSINKVSTDASEIIELHKKGELNILLVDIQRDMDKTLSFRLGNTNKILVIYSYSHLTKLQKK